MLELHVADVLLRHTDSAEPPAGPNPGAAADKTGSDAQQGMHVDEVRLRGLTAPLNRIHDLQGYQK